MELSSITFFVFFILIRDAFFYHFVKKIVVNRFKQCNLLSLFPMFAQICFYDSTEKCVPNATHRKWAKSDFTDISY